MSQTSSNFRKTVVAFCTCFAICLILGIAFAYATPATAAPPVQQPTPAAGESNYLGPEFCATCHEDIHKEWTATRHAAAFSSPIFQKNWTEDPNRNECLQCHTTGYDAETGTFALEGVTCESCHGAFQVGHPKAKMPITPDATLCASCHKTTTNEWQASRHSEIGIQCQACHDPHSQTPKAENVNALCSNCHKDPGQTFTHGTHANSGLQCSDCHMYRNPNTLPIGGLLATGHTFVVGSEACIGCHRDTVHTRDKIVALTGEVEQLADLNVEELRQKAQEQAQEIADLKTSGETRLYVGLVQGAIVGLAVGGVAAWIVSRRLRVVTEIVEDDEQQPAGGG